MEIGYVNSSNLASYAVQTSSKSVVPDEGQPRFSLLQANVEVEKTSDKKKYSYEFNAAPEAVLKKYDLNHITEDAYRDMEYELLQNENEESRKLGLDLITDDITANPSINHESDSFTMLFPGGQAINLLDRIWGEYESQTALHGSGTYEKELYDTLQRLQASAHPTNGAEVQESLSREIPSASTVSQISRSKATKGEEDTAAVSEDDAFWNEVYTLWITQHKEPEVKKKTDEEQRVLDRVDSFLDTKQRPSLEDILKKLALAKENETVEPAEKLSLLQSEQNTLKNESTEAFLQMYMEMQKVRA